MILDRHGKPARSHIRAQSYSGGFSPYFEAAKRSGYRTWFYFPSLNPEDQITEFTREEIARKLNWLYNNCPAFAGAVDGLAEEIADTGLWPTPTTDNPQFNRAVSDNFETDGDDPRFFDEAGEETFSTAQKAILRNIFMLHDFFGQLLRPGVGSAIPTIHFVPAWQVGNGPDQTSANKNASSQPLNSSTSQPRWIDGTLANDRGRIFKYSVFNDPKKKSTVEVDANDLLHFHDALWKGQRRGLSPFASAVRKLYSLDDIDRAATSGELSRQRVAYQITRGIGDDDEPTMVPGGELVETIETENPDGTKTRNYIQRIVSHDGTDIDIADLGPGRKIEMVESTKGGAAKEWSEHILADCARAIKAPPVYVFFLGGLSQGTEVRWIQKRVQRWKNYWRQHLLIPQFCRRWYNFKTWQDIIRGRYDNVQGGIPANWYKHRWNPPADDSVDIGREGHLYDDRLDSGKMSRRRYHAIDGQDWGDETDEIIDERVAIEMKIEDRRAKLENRQPDYAHIAARLSYDLIFKESKIAQRVTETAAELEDPLQSPTPPSTQPASRRSLGEGGRPQLNGNGSHQNVRI